MMNLTEAAFPLQLLAKTFVQVREFSRGYSTRQKRMFSERVIRHVAAPSN